MLYFNTSHGSCVYTFLEKSVTGDIPLAKPFSSVHCFVKVIGTPTSSDDRSTIYSFQIYTGLEIDFRWSCIGYIEYFRTQKKQMKCYLEYSEKTGRADWRYSCLNFVVQWIPFKNTQVYSKRRGRRVTWSCWEVESEMEVWKYVFSSSCLL